MMNTANHRPPVRTHLTRSSRKPALESMSLVASWWTRPYLIFSAADDM